MSRRTALFLLVFNAANFIGWAVMLPIVMLSGLKSSVPFISAISVWALVGAFLTATIASVVALGQTQAVEQRSEILSEVKEHREHNRIFHRRVSEKLDIDPPA